VVDLAIDIEPADHAVVCRTTSIECIRTIALRRVDVEIRSACRCCEAESDGRGREKSKQGTPRRAEVGVSCFQCWRLFFNGSSGDLQRRLANTPVARPKCVEMSDG
jgi:hypothetical protein